MLPSLSSTWLPAPHGGTPLHCGVGVDVIWAAALRAHQSVMAVPAEHRVPELPPTLPPAAPPELRWSHQLLMCRLPQTPGAGPAPAPGTATATATATANIMAQGWLFEHELAQDQERQGISRYPLVGVWGESHGLAAPSGGHDACDAGFGGGLAPADQHIHCVKEVLDLGGHAMELADWHVGSDMARVAVDSAEGAAGWAVVLDVHAMRGIECLVVVLPGGAPGRGPEPAFGADATPVAAEAGSADAAAAACAQLAACTDALGTLCPGHPG